MPSYILMNVVSSKMSMYFPLVSEDSPLNSTLMV